MLLFPVVSSWHWAHRLSLGHVHLWHHPTVTCSIARLVHAVAGGNRKDTSVNAHRSYHAPTLPVKNFSFFFKKKKKHQPSGYCRRLKFTDPEHLLWKAVRGANVLWEWDQQMSDWLVWLAPQRAVVRLGIDSTYKAAGILVQTLGHLHICRISYEKIIVKCFNAIWIYKYFSTFQHLPHYLFYHYWFIHYLFKQLILISMHGEAGLIFILYIVF